MSRYLVIALAIVIGGLIGLWLSRRDKSAETTLVDADSSKPLWPWLAGLAVLFVGLFMLASHERADIQKRYQPATLTNGDIQPGQFEQPQDDNN